MATSAQVIAPAWRDILLLLLSAPLYVLGYLAGIIVRATLWVAAAIVAGYKAGMDR